MTREELGFAIKTKGDEAKAIFAKADGENRPLNEDERESVKRLNDETKEYQVSLKSLQEQDGLRDEIKARLDWLGQPIRPQEFPGGRTDDRKSLGERFVNSEEFKSWWKAMAPSGSLHENQKIGNSPALQVLGSLKSLVTGVTGWTPRSDTGGGALVQLDQRGLLDGGVYRRPLLLQDLIPTSPTSGDTVEYVRVTGFTNSAAPVAEATATGGSSGVKPESGHAFEVINERVKTIAHWEPITRRALADAGQLRGLIDEDLRYGIEEELEDQLISGSGTGENLTGVLNVTGRLLQVFVTDILTTSRKAITNLRLNGREVATGWVIHPTDWEAFDLLTDNEDRYYWQGPAVLGDEMLWGRPVIQSEGTPVGTAVLGNWQKARIWDREQTNIYVSDSHADFFIRNLLAILAERRLAFGVVKPKAFVKVLWS